MHGNAVLAVGAMLRDGALITLAEKETMALDVAQSGRVDVEGPAHLQLGTDMAGQLLLASGIVSVNVPPAGDGKLISQRIVTPRATFSFRAGTLAALAVDARGDVLVHVVSGRAEIAADTEGTAAHVDPGAAKRLESTSVTDLKPGEDLSSARLKVRAFVRAAAKTPARPSAEAAARLHHDTADRLEAALATLAGEMEQGAQITGRHKQAVVSGDATERSIQQRALATHGQRLFRLRGVVLVLWERMQVAALAMAPDEAARAALSTWRDRVGPVLPRE